MTATAHATLDGTAASSERLSSVASGVLAFIWPMYLTLVLTLGAWVLVPALLLGWEPMTIISGSMAPTVQPGHVVMVEPYGGQSLETGDVVTFRDNSQDRLVTHRVASIDEDGNITTRGDANAVDDPIPLTSDRIVGVGRLVVPAAGMPALWAHQGRMDLLAVIVVLTVLAAASAASAVSTGARTVRHELSLRGGSPRRSRVRDIGLATAVIVVMAVVGATTVSRAAFVGAQDNASNAFQAGTIGTPGTPTATSSCALLTSLLTGPKVDLTWSAGSGATGYAVLRSTNADSGYSVIAETTGTSYTDESVGTGTTYHYRVRSTAGGWTSSDSATVTVTTPAICLL